MTERQGEREREWKRVRERERGECKRKESGEKIGGKLAASKMLAQSL